MCLPGRVGVPDNSNTLDHSQPKEQGQWHEKRGSIRKKPRGEGESAADKEVNISRMSRSRSPSFSPHGGMCGSDGGQPAQVLVAEPVSWTRVSKLTAPSSHFAMHGFIHTLSKLLLNTHLSCTAEISSSKNVLPAI